MRFCSKLLACASVITVVLAANPANAGDSARKFEWSFNIGATTDYVFRGFSQTAEDPAIQGGADVSYGGLYAGIWASNLDFGEGAGSASTEIDLYAGYKYQLGPAELDLGVIYYVYPNADDAGAELDYVEIKLGASSSVDKFSFGAVGYYSPEYTGELGEALTFEGTVSYELPSFRDVTPTIGGLIGTTQFLDNLAEDYVYWNAGVSFGIKQFTLDFRYWDTDLADSACSGEVFACDERFVASVNIALP